MGFFSGFCDFVSSAASSFSSAVSSVWEGAKSVAKSAISWIADKAETVVDSVKKVWKTVKPYIPKIRKALKVAAEAVPWPWLRSGLLLLEKGLLFIENFENTVLGKKVIKAINRVIKMAKDIYATFFNDEEMKDAKERDDLFKEAQKAAEGNTEAEKTIALAKMLNAYGIINREVYDLLTERSELLSFDHYLRLRATQKLLLDVEDMLRMSQKIENINEDDIFLIEVAKELIAENPALSTENAIKLDSIIYKRKKKNLLPFVFEEMIAAWYKTTEELEREWQVKSKEVAKLKIDLRRLQNEQAITDLPVEGLQKLKELQIIVPQEIDRVDLLARRKRERTSYVYAAEGLLQTIEKTEEELERDDLGFMLEESAEVGQLIIDCLQNGKRWEELMQDEKDIIMDYANIFEEDCRERTESLLKVTA